MNKPLHYVTGSESKFLTAQHILQKFGVDIAQTVLDIPEVQAETTAEVAIDKAKQAFEKVGEPVLVSDHGWYVTALNGFPGPYMKYVNNWLEPQDFLALMARHSDRSVVLRQDLVYRDSATMKLFSYDISGYLLHKSRGKMGTSWDKIVCLTSDDKSIAETRDTIGAKLILSNETEPWQGFAAWYKRLIT
jgi:non-canonical purine NTP pyrophosphatase (RdgB/HAM1 family)